MHLGEYHVNSTSGKKKNILSHKLGSKFASLKGPRNYLNNVVKFFFLGGGKTEFESFFDRKLC